MRHMTFADGDQESYDIALLVTRLDRAALEKTYLTPYLPDPRKVIALSLEQQGKKTPVKIQKAYLETLLPVLRDLKVRYLLVTDSDYFKTLTGAPKAEPTLGYVLPLKPQLGQGYAPWVVYVPNPGSVFYDPDKALPKIGQGMTALLAHLDDQYREPGQGIIHSATYPRSVEEIAQALQRLLTHRVLSADIEGFSLKHHNAGIGTIAFAWNQHEGLAFPIDCRELLSQDEDRLRIHKIRNDKVRALLRDFFIEAHRRGIKLIWHHISYDVYVLIYQLFMTDLLDTEGLLYGMEILLSHWEDTKLIAYLATNSCARNELGLKQLAQEFSGNYAVDEIEDICRIPLPKLLEYNLVDTLSTWFIYTKYWERMVADQQLEIYRSLFQPAIRDIVQMQLTGMPLDMARVREVKALLEADEKAALDRLAATQTVRAFTDLLNWEWVEWKNSTLKKKRVSLSDAKEVFNPNSDPQLRKLLYDCLQLPVIDLTDSKLPSTAKDSIKALKAHTTHPDILEFLDALVKLKDVSILLTTFIPAFETAVQGPDGWHYLFGFFNLGGTVSARLSSSKPNLQNIPANSVYAKLIKSCFVAPPGWLFVGLDFASLEDRISALTTKDPNKLKVYTDGYDGHCLRAYGYFGDQMPDIDPNSVASINSIADKYKALRQDSKTPTFLLTYGGTYHGIMAQLGWSEEKARQVEEKYHALYVVSDQWVAARLDEASRHGYVVAAFGLRVRTPLLKQTIRGTKSTPYEAAAEGRTAGNALGQSWCLLNSRAVVEFMGKVRESEFRLDIRPCAQIHDASYYLIRNSLDPVLYTNTHLVQAAEWNDHPDIYHPEVGLGGEVAIYYPSWAHELGLPNRITEPELLAQVQSHLAKLHEKGIL